MNTLIPMQSVVIKLKMIIGKELADRLDNLDYNSVDRALYVAKIFCDTNAISLEGAVDLICYKEGAYKENKDYVDNFVKSLNKD